MSAKPDTYDLIRSPSSPKRPPWPRKPVPWSSRSRCPPPSRRSRKPWNRFSGQVTAVNTVVTKGKVKKFRGRPGERSDRKKAYVTLAEGNTIDVSTGL